LTNSPVAVVPTETERAEQAAFQRVASAIYSAEEALAGHQPVDFPALREGMEKYWAEYPNAWRSALNVYMGVFAKAHPDRVLAEWASFTNCINPREAQLAEGKVRFATLSRQPFEFTVTAIDGRAVDLAKLRGKVVLIDFWATWCVPCVQQIPELKQLYGKYHEQGFEIIGIALDRAEDKQKLLKFISQQSLAWPQYYDGKVWQNEIAARYGVHSAPTTFLLDQEGNLVGINLEGKLEAEVKRLLGLKPVAPK
jgi:thiol-disulfide isomerase/thioredoxin